MDGKTLAAARKKKEDIRLRSVARAAERQRFAYRAEPRLEAVERRLAGIAAQVAMSALGGGRPLQELHREMLGLQEEKADILARLGKPADWLDGAWECPDCLDTGYREGRPCGCLLKLYDEARAEELSQLVTLGDESFETFRLDYYDADCRPGQTYSPREQMQMVLDFCRQYAEHFDRGASNLLMYGSTGLGKTFLSACIARTVYKNGFSVVYDTVVSVISAYETVKFRGTGDVEKAQAYIDRLESCDLLIIDDLGTEMVTEFTRSALYTLVNTRIIKRASMIISTNLSPAELEKKYTQQITSRLLGEFQNLPFVGSDIRRLRRGKI